MKTKPRLERLLEASIRNELQIKAMRRELCELSAQFALFRQATVPLVPRGTIKTDADAWRAQAYAALDQRCYP